jgi:hypothetical protein
MAKVKVHPLSNFHHEGEMVYAGGRPVMMDKVRAEAMKAAGNVRFDGDKVDVVESKLSLLQVQGRPNAEPKPTPYPGDPVTPAPGEGPVERPELTAEPPVDHGTVNPEPKAAKTNGEISPAPGPGRIEVTIQDPYEIADRARMKVIENRAPNDPGAAHEDNYAIPVEALASPATEAPVSEPVMATETASPAKRASRGKVQR